MVDLRWTGASPVTPPAAQTERGEDAESEDTGTTFTLRDIVEQRITLYFKCENCD